MVCKRCIEGYYVSPTNPRKCLKETPTCGDGQYLNTITSLTGGSDEYECVNCPEGCTSCVLKN